MLTSRVSSLSESRPTLSDVTSQPLSSLNRAIAAYAWFQADSFLGHSLLRCMSADPLKALASLDLNYYVACMYSCSLTLAVKARFL